MSLLIDIRLFCTSLFTYISTPSQCNTHQQVPFVCLFFLIHMTTFVHLFLFMTTFVHLFLFMTTFVHLFLFMTTFVHLFLFTSQLFHSVALVSRSLLYASSVCLFCTSLLYVSFACLFLLIYNSLLQGGEDS